MEMDDTEKKQLGEDLMLASKNGDVTTVQEILDTQATSGNISNYRNADGRTPLMNAARYGHLEIASKLIMAGANVNEADQDGVTALMLAVGRGHTGTVSKLIESGAIVDAADKDGETALLIAAWRGQLETVVSKLIESGAMVNKINKNSETPLMVAAWHGHLRIVIKLIENRASVDATDEEGDTALIIAARHGQLETVSELIKSGATVDQPNKAGRTALMAAAEQGHAETVSKLIESANVDAVDKNGKSALILAAEVGHAGVVTKFSGSNMDIPKEKNGRTALMAAACQGHLETVSKLIESGASVDTTDEDGRTALLLAARHGHPEIVSRLIASESRVTATDKDGKSALILAAEGGHPDVVTKLMDGKGKWSVNNTDKDGSTALTHAALQGHLETVSRLIASGAIVDVDDENGQTALMWAAGSGQLEIVSKLIGSGAKLDTTNTRGETALMWAAWQDHLQIVRTLLESGARLDITSKDHYNALDVAIASGNEDIAMEIIKNPNWKLAMRNCYHSKSEGLTTPLRELIKKMPEVAEQVFDQCIMPIGNQVKYNYEFLDDFRDSPPKRPRRNCWSSLFRPRHDRVHAEVELQPIANQLQNDDDAEDSASSGGFTNNWGPIGFKQETHPVTIMVKSEQVNLLNHPLVTSLITFTWAKIGYSIYCANLAVYLVFLAFLTSFALTVPNPQSCSDAVEAERLADNTSLDLSIDCSNLLSDTRRIFVVAAAVSVIIFAVVRLVIEVFQLIQLRERYIQDWINWMEVALTVFAIMFVAVFNNECQCPRDWQWQIGIVAVFLAWINLMIFMSKLPWVGIYVVMFTNIFKIFIKLIFLSILLLVAFGLPLHMAFFEPGVIRTPFASPARSLLKTITMTTGELGFDEIFRQVPGGTRVTDDGLEEIPFPPVSYILWIVFIVLMPILLSNLLVGLAVDDIKNTLKKAELQQLGLKVELLLTIAELFRGIINQSYTTLRSQEYTDQLLHQCEEDEITQSMKQLQAQAETLGANVDHINQDLIADHDEDLKQIQHQTETLRTDIDHIKHQTETLGADVNHIKQTLTKLEGYIQKMAMKQGITEGTD